MSTFHRHIGIDYSGAETPTTSLKGLRVYLAEGDEHSVEVPPPPSPRKYWTRKGIAAWLVERLSEDAPTLVGIDHGFSFPLRYFEAHGLKPDWLAFLDDFQRHWPTDVGGVWVRDILRGNHGAGAARCGDKTWFRSTEMQTKLAKSVSTSIRSKDASPFQPMPAFPGCASFASDSARGFTSGPSTAGKFRLGGRLSPRCIRPWSPDFVKEGRTADQHDAFSIAAWLSRADHNGSLAMFLKPDLASSERTLAQVEGWILGVQGSCVGKTHKLGLNLGRNQRLSIN